MKDLLLNAKILIIDDSFETLSLLGNLLTSKSYIVIPASNGEQAIALAKSKNPDLILLDIGLPGMDGYEVCEVLKRENGTCDIPIIFLTGKTNTDEIVKGLSLGAVDYIHKPYSQIELLARVETHLRLVKMRERILEDKTLLHLKEMELIEKEKEKAEIELLYKNKELINLALQLTKYSRTSEEHMNTMFDAIQTLKRDEQDKLSSILNSCKRQLEDSNWMNIEEHFLKLHHTFFATLLQSYPDLSKNELRLCAFIRLNMSVKDMASITLQSEDTIKKARYRLRQKLSIDSDESLHSLIMRF